MLPVVAGRTETKKQILIYSILLLPVSMIPWVVGFAGAIYGAIALISGTTMILFAVRLHRCTNATETSAAGRLFAFSIFHLFVLFASLLAGTAIVHH
jgi:protoheme IX farnesyltransferase